MNWICAAQIDSLSISQSMGVWSVRCARVLENALWIWIGLTGNRLLYFTALNQFHSQRLRKWESEMWARQIVQPTDIHSPDGKMEIYSFSLPLSLPDLPHRLIRLTTTSSFLCVSEPFCILRRKSFISLECYCLSRMLEDHSGNKSALFFPSLFPSLHPTCHFQTPHWHIYFHCNTFCHHAVQKVQQQAFFFAWMLHFCFVPPPLNPLCSPLLCCQSKDHSDSWDSRLRNAEIFFH